jgi:hypothetical protein
MIKVRSGVFETNSSSTHSLVLSPNFDGMIDPPLPESTLDAGVYHIFPGEFGWEEEEYFDIASKASYLYVDAMQYADSTVEPNDVAVQNENIHLKMIADAFKLHAGVPVEFHKENGSYPFGYIDHQSVGICSDVWSEGVNGVIRFIFSNNSSFTTDNDNH